MNRLLYLLVTIFVLLVSCNSSDDGITDEHFDYTYVINSQILLSENPDFNFVSIDTGQDLVFKYIFTAAEDSDIADDEYSERIIFQINRELHEFDYSNEELLSIMAYFDQYCFCDIPGSIQITTGSIIGEKISAKKWDITIDITFLINEQEVSKLINGVFILE